MQFITIGECCLTFYLWTAILYHRDTLHVSFRYSRVRGDAGTAGMNGRARAGKGECPHTRTSSLLSSAVTQTQLDQTPCRTRSRPSHLSCKLENTHRRIYETRWHRRYSKNTADTPSLGLGHLRQLMFSRWRRRRCLFWVMAPCRLVGGCRHFG